MISSVITRQFKYLPAIASLLCISSQLFAQNVAGTPLYGEIRIRGNVYPNPYVVEVEAGGATDAADLVTNCVGYITRSQPDINIFLENAGDQFGIFVNSGTDTTLMVNAPDGSWFCNDDATYLSNTNPGLFFSTPQSGSYKIWVGTFSENTNESAQLVFTNLSTSAWSGLDLVATEGVPQIGTPRYDTIELNGGFSNDPYVLTVETGGGTQVNNLDSGCLGYVAASRPDVVLDYSGNEALGIFAESDSDTTLIVSAQIRRRRSGVSLWRWKHSVRHQILAWPTACFNSRCLLCRAIQGS